jgi:hypothetical protein
VLHAPPRSYKHMATLAVVRAKLWGRSRWQWGLELLVVVCFVVVLVESDRLAIKLLAAGCVLIRVVTSAFQFTEWRRRQGRAVRPAEDDAGDGGAVSRR